MYNGEGLNETLRWYVGYSISEVPLVGLQVKLNLCTPLKII